MRFKVAAASGFVVFPLSVYQEMYIYILYILLIL